MSKYFFNIVLPAFAAIVLLLTYFGRLGAELGNYLFVIIFSVFVIYFGYTKINKSERPDFISIFYVVFGVIMLLFNAWSLWRIL